MTDRQKLVAAVLTVVPTLLLACSQWIRADATKREKEAAYQSYGEYVTDQLHRDEALLRALRDCYARRGYTYGLRGKVADLNPDDRQAQPVLDEIARRGGWEGEVR